MGAGVEVEAYPLAMSPEMASSRSGGPEDRRRWRRLTGGTLGGATERGMERWGRGSSAGEGIERFFSHAGRFCAGLGDGIFDVIRSNNRGTSLYPFIFK